MKISLVVNLSCVGSCVDENSQWQVEAVRPLEPPKTQPVADAKAMQDVTKGQVLNLVRKAGDRGMTERDISTSSRRFSALSEDDQDTVLEDMANAGKIVRAERVSASGLGRKRIAWVAV